jgi:hypothetical protein
MPLARAVVKDVAIEHGACIRPTQLRRTDTITGQIEPVLDRGNGKTFRLSLFLTLTCPSYGRVTSDGTPADPDIYDYTRAARDALPPGLVASHRHPAIRRRPPARLGRAHKHPRRPGHRRVTR